MCLVMHRVTRKTNLCDLLNTNSDEFTAVSVAYNHVIERFTATRELSNDNKKPIAINPEAIKNNQ